MNKSKRLNIALYNTQQALFEISIVAMEETSSAASSNQQSSSPNAKIDPPNKRRKSSMLADTPGTSSPIPGVLEAMDTVTEQVEFEPQFHFKQEGMPEDSFNELEEFKVSAAAAAAIRKQKNEESCPIYKLSNDELKLIFGYAGEKQYRCVACVSYIFHQVYLDTFRGGAVTSFKRETLTSFKRAVASVSCAAVRLDSEEPGCDNHAVSLFRTAATEGKLEILIWGEESGYDLKHLLGERTMSKAALNGHLEVVKYLRQLDILWDRWTCRNAALNCHLKLLKWCRANHCPWESWTCANAALKGHLEVLKWARTNQCHGMKGHVPLPPRMVT